MEKETAVNLEERELGGAIPLGATIQVVRGFFEGLRLPIDRDWVVIGRGRSADLVIAEPTISRAHAAIGFDGEHFFIEDLGSTNGTSVNGKRAGQVVRSKRAPRSELNTGDEIRMGKLLLKVTLPSESETAGL
jgi:pSer/pThr/pTyr-binding forkhead associated (FHA) protein